MPRPLSTSRPLLCLLVAGVAGCDAVGRYLAESPGDRLVEEAVAAWTERGSPFLDGVSGPDTVATVTPTGARGWEVAVGPPEGGLPTVWSLEVPRAEVYPVFPGDAFAGWLDARARSSGFADGLPPDVMQAIRTADIRAVGALEVRYGPASGSTRTTLERVAYLVPRPYSDATEWHVQPDSSAAGDVLVVLERAVDPMAREDPRTRSCMGGRAPPEVDREVTVRCFAETLTRRFGPR